MSFGVSISIDYFEGYKTNLSVDFKTDFPGYGQAYDATLGVINFGYVRPVDVNGNHAEGYNIYYYGAGPGYNVNVGGIARTSIY